MVFQWRLRAVASRGSVSRAAVAVLALAGGLLASAAGWAQPVDQDTILIGDVTTIARIGEPALSYQHGRDVAAGFIGLSGGVIGNKRIEIVAIDAGGDPAAAEAAVRDLKAQGAALFVGGLLSDVTLAAARAAGDTPFLAVDARLPSAVARDLPNLLQVGPSAETLGDALAQAAAETDALRWGVVGQDDYFGRAVAHAFWSRLRSLRPEVTLVGDRYVATLSGAVNEAVSTLSDASPDGLLVALRAGDLVAFAQRASEAGLLAGRVVAVPQAGSPELLGALGSLTDQGQWIVTGYPCCEVGGQPHRAFAEAYRNGPAGPPPGTATPTLSALYGYTAVTSLASALDRAWSAQPDKVMGELLRARLSSPVGDISFSAQTRQSSLPVWIGRVDQGRFVDWTVAASPAGQ